MLKNEEEEEEKKQRTTVKLLKSVWWSTIEGYSWIKKPSHNTS